MKFLIFQALCKAVLLSGLLAMIFYAPYDMCGAKFLWFPGLMLKQSKSCLADLRSSSEALDLVLKCFNMFQKQLEDMLEFAEVEIMIPAKVDLA